MPHADLQAYRDGFLQKFLAELPGAPSLATLEQQQPAGKPLALFGDYIEYTGAPLAPLPGTSIKPQFAIRTEAAGKTQTFVMLWVVERLDVATDSAETMARILADFRPATAVGSAEREGLASDLAQKWSKALAAGPGWPARGDPNGLSMR